MDIVYPYKQSGDGLELRYSLRSLANIPHDRVIIAGDCPPWAEHVTHIPVSPTGGKYENSLANILAACEDPRVSDDFILMNDDFFVLSPQREVPVYHLGTIEEYVASREYRDEYMRLVIRTEELLKAEGIAPRYFYGVHVPTVLNKQKVRVLCERFHGKPIMLRTLYHNLYRSGGIRREDVKKYQRHEQVTETDYLSVSDGYAASPVFTHLMRRNFPSPCYYESV